MLSKKSPRKVPSQERARATVDIILDACELVAGRSGVEKLSVNAIASRAGVGRGSIYQYFGGLEGLVAAWEERALAREVEGLVAALASHAAQSTPLEEAIADLVHRGLQVFVRRMTYYKDPASADFASRLVERLRLNHELYTPVRIALANAPPGDRIRRTDLATASRVAVKAVGYLAFDAGVSGLRGAELERFEREVTDMILVYLLRDPPVGA